MNHPAVQGSVRKSTMPSPRLSLYDPREVLTILTATSALACHPSTAMIERAVESLGTHAGLSGCRHLIVCDGSPENHDELASRYKAYKQRLRTLAQDRRFCTKTEVLELERPAGLPGVILAGTMRIRTPFLLVYEHDWEIGRVIDTRGILRTLTHCRGVQYVRLNKRRNREAGFDFVLKPDVRRRPVPLIRTSTWSANPHFARVSYYRRMVIPRLTEQPGGGSLGFEDPLCWLMWAEIRHFGFDRAHRRWGVFIYGRLGDPPVVRHLDGRHLPGQESASRRPLAASLFANRDD